MTRTGKRVPNRLPAALPMTYDATRTLQDFLAASAAKQPAPGGGSVAALAGALSAAMGEMVLNYSVGKKSLESHQEQIKHALAHMHRARQMMLELMIEDQLAYQALTAARKLPADSPQRAADFPAALLASIRAPEAIAATAAAVLAACDRLVDVINPYLLSDLAVCAELAMATIRCGIYNVLVNQSDVSDPQDRQRIEETISHLLGQATQTIQRVIPRIWERQRQPQ